MLRFRRRRRTIRHWYNSITSEQFDKCAARGAGRANRLGDAERLELRGAVIDARGTGRPVAARLRLAEVRRAEFSHRRAARRRPADRHGRDGRADRRLSLRLCACPSPSDRMFVEDTYYSDTPDLDRRRASSRGSPLMPRRRAGTVAAGRDAKSRRAAGRDGRRFRALLARRAARGAKAGMRAGLFHPTTGYSLPDAVRLAARSRARRRSVGAGAARC